MNIILKDKTLESKLEGQKVYYTFDGKEWHEEWDQSLAACKVVMDEHLHDLEPIRQQVLDGKLSPLAYHTQVYSFTIKLLSSYTEIPKRHIKKHFKPENFIKLDEETLKKYAAALGISVEELKKV